MNAIVQDGTGSADVLTLRQIALPDLPDDRILIRVRAASVNASDYHTVHGGWLVTVLGKILRAAKPYPIRGGDVAGTVEAVGKNITLARPGDEVFGVGRGTWAEYATGSERGILPKPARLSFTEAAAVGGAAITALQALRDHGQVRAGQDVLVYGAGGGVGTYAVQIGKALGARITAVTGPRNIEVVTALGADEIVDYTKEDVLARRARYDAVIDIAATKPMGTLMRALAPTGRLVAVGAAKRGGWLGVIGRLIAATVRSRLLKQRIVVFIASIRRDDLAYLAELIEAGKLRPVIERTYPLAETREAVRYALTGQARAKIVLIP
jgi:NADPH:quinone reductase-like Zn-dependent oxidoreductase